MADAPEPADTARQSARLERPGDPTPARRESGFRACRGVGCFPLREGAATRSRGARLDESAGSFSKPSTHFAHFSPDGPASRLRQPLGPAPGAGHRPGRAGVALATRRRGGGRRRRRERAVGVHPAVAHRAASRQLVGRAVRAGVAKTSPSRRRVCAERAKPSGLPKTPSRRRPRRRRGPGQNIRTRHSVAAIFIIGETFALRTRDDALPENAGPRPRASSRRGTRRPTRSRATPGPRSGPSGAARRRSTVGTGRTDRPPAARTGRRSSRRRTPRATRPTTRNCG